MQPQKRASALIIGGLILATVVIMAVAGQADTWMARRTAPVDSGDGGQLHLAGRLVQDKILQGAEGRVGLALTLTAPDTASGPERAAANVDLVVVLDRSGSMNGRKIDDARQAVLNLAERLSPRDRLALVTYSDRVAQLSALTPMTATGRGLLQNTVEAITTNGGTNLGAGLKHGLAVAAQAADRDNARRVILISDGLANQGITDPYTLGTMAAAGSANALTVSTVGVGQGFNEHLMTALADHGGGSYHYLENPAAFAAVFQKEYQYARTAAADGIRVELPLPEGVRLVDAGGYPISQSGGRARFNVGSLRYGQSRRLFVTLAVPTHTPQTYRFEGIRAHFRHGGREQRVSLAETFTVACVDDARDVVASIRKEVWSDQVVRADFGRLKEEVAADIREGKATQARERIRAYRQEKAAINAVVGSARVSQNLAQEVDALSAVVEETFQGPAPAVAAKQKKNAKALQYDGYRERRDKH